MHTEPPDAVGRVPQVPVAMDLRSNTLQTVLQAVAELAVRGTTAAAAASVTLMSGDRPITFAATGPLAAALDETQYEQGYGPCLDAVLSGDVIEIADCRDEVRWPKFTPVAVEHGALSSLSVPIPVVESVAAALNVYATTPSAFGAEERRGVLDLVAFAAAAIANMHLYEMSRTRVEQMQAAAQSRAVIDQARGILMAQRGMTPEEAFALLRTTSQHANRKIRDLAQDIVDGITGGVPGAPGG